ncbi:head GIN domain-containing protein [Aquimarina rhabdastrellae]
MKNLMYIFLLCIGINASAQEVIEKKVSRFNELKVFDKIQLTLVKSNVNKVEISGIYREKIDVVQKNGKLKIKMALNNLWDNNNTQVTVYYTYLEIIDVNEGAVVKTEETIENETIVFKAQEGGKIYAGVKANSFIGRAVTGGYIETFGESKEQEITIKAGGEYQGQDLTTVNSLIKISAGGRGSVNASKYVKANTNAGGTIRIYGNPRQIDSKKVLGGKIIEVN